MSIEGVIFNDGVEAATQKHQADIDRLTNELRVAREALMRLQADRAFTLARNIHPMLESAIGLLYPLLEKRIKDFVELECDRQIKEAMDKLSGLDKEEIHNMVQGELDDVLDDKISEWMEGNFDIKEYSDEIEEEVKESLENMSGFRQLVKETVEGLDFQISVI